jgi:streptogramin lyase
MSIHDAEPSDVYVDEQGKLWRVIGKFSEPAVTVEEVEPTRNCSPHRRTGGVSGCMWQGFVRIYRPPDIPKMAAEIMTEAKRKASQGWL